jgi:hypothetical protein
VLQDDRGHVLTSIDAVDAGARITARVLDGRLALTVDGMRRDPATPEPETNEDDDD